MTLLRKPCVAGQFYPDKPQVLNQMLNQMLNVTPVLGPPKAIIAPHAGYVYSGSVAGKIYATLRPVRDKIKHVILFGPAHRVGFRGLATTRAKLFETPLGLINVNETLVDKAITLPQVFIEERAFVGEHSLEVHLPFLQSSLSQFTLVPFVCGQQSDEIAAKVMDLLWGKDDTLIVVSSDLSHYLDYDSCVAKDKQTSNQIVNKDWQHIDDDGACGRIPIKGLLKVALDKDLTVTEVDLKNSGDTAGNKDRVVGYGAYHIK